MAGRRLRALPLVLLAASVLVFLLPRAAGLDVTRTVLRARVADSSPDPAAIDRVTRELGLDGPLWQQYLLWLGGILRGDLGLSFATRMPVAPTLLTALGVSIALSTLALAVAGLVGVPAGVLAARRPGGLTDRSVTALSVLGAALPEFILAPVLVLLLAVVVPLFPATGWGSPAAAVLPVLTLALFPTALAAQLTRAETADTLRALHVTAARARGLTERRLLWVHTARRSLTSVTALSGTFLAGLLGGSVVVEVVFAIPGLGRLLYDGVLAQDLPTVQGGLLLVVAVAVLATGVTELVQFAADPVARRGAR